MKQNEKSNNRLPLLQLSKCHLTSSNLNIKNSLPPTVRWEKLRVRFDVLCTLISFWFCKISSLAICDSYASSPLFSIFFREIDGILFVSDPSILSIRLREEKYFWMTERSQFPNKWCFFILIFLIFYKAIDNGYDLNEIQRTLICIVIRWIFLNSKLVPMYDKQSCMCIVYMCYRFHITALNRLYLWFLCWEY